MKKTVWQKRRQSAFSYFAVFLPIIFYILIYQQFPSFFNFQLHTNILILLIVSPILEELTFRGLLQNLILRYSNSYVFTIILVNFAFVALHYSVNRHILYMLAIFICGIIFSVIKVYYKKIVFPIIVHVYYNLCFIVFIKFIH